MCADSLKHRYTLTAQESGTIRKRWEGKLSIALAFPNTYYVGMSNLGFQIMYRQLNRSDDIVCERVFLPEGKTRFHPQHSATLISSVESTQPLTAFHIIAFSLSFENDYLNILTMLTRARISCLHKDRDRRAPLIIGGGVSVMLNPEPLADLFDLFVIGEAEEIIEEFLDVFRHNHHGTHWEKPALDAFAHIEGIYVPSAYHVRYHDDGRIAAFTPHAGFPATVKRRWIKDLNRVPGFSCVVTPHTEFGSMFLAEVSRGCPRRCRFCAAGHVYRPYRRRDSASVLQEIAAHLSDLKKLGLLGAAVGDYPDLEQLVQHIMDNDCAVSVSSLRADTLTENLIELLKKSGHMTFTIAPETGSKKLRRVIAKDLTDEAIFEAVTLLARQRITSLKLYFLVGLPAEDDGDVEAIIHLTRQIKHMYFKEVRSQKWLKQITVSISVFVPKPWTPFQWHPFTDITILKKRLKVITNGLKKEKKVVVTHDLPKWSYIQALLSRGDRRTTQFLLQALETGGDWRQVFREGALNPDFYVYRERAAEELFPWDFINHGLSKQNLWQEYQKALRTG
jgi:radical SAM superfamily enzyme YgiQ (UPF0313 family)